MEDVICGLRSEVVLVMNLLSEELEGMNRMSCKNLKSGWVELLHAILELLTGVTIFS